jgi:MFS family permease
MIQAADTPLRQTLLPELVPAREDLPSAVAFGAFMQQSGRLIGPTIAGLILAAWSEAACFLVNAIAKLAVIAAVVVMQLPERAQASKPKRMGSAFAEGVRYAWQTVPVRILLPTLAAASFLVAPYQSLMPIFAAEVFHGGAQTLGWLMGAAGLGGAVSVVALAARKDVRGLARIIFFATLTAGLGLTAFSVTRWFWLGMLLMPLIGAGMLAVITGTSTVLQVIVDDEKRGRVMSLYTMSFLGMMPMGSLAAGIVADLLGAPLTLTLFGALCVGAALVYGSKMPDATDRTRVMTHAMRSLLAHVERKHALGLAMLKQLVPRLLGERLKVFHRARIGRQYLENLTGRHVRQRLLCSKYGQGAVETPCVEFFIVFDHPRLLAAQAPGTSYERSVRQAPGPR